jgi:hypothetical protein
VEHKTPLERNGYGLQRELAVTAVHSRVRLSPAPPGDSKVEAIANELILQMFFSSSRRTYKFEGQIRAFNTFLKYIAGMKLFLQLA